MGEKGNLLDMGDEIFANLAAQGPQFWLDYERYRQTRAKAAGAQVAMERQVGAEDPAAERPEHPATD